MALALSGEQASAHLGTHHFFSPIFSGSANVKRALPDRAFWTRSIHVENEGGLTRGIPAPVSIGYASCDPKRTKQWLRHFFVPNLIGFLLSQHRQPCSILKIDPVHPVFADFLYGNKEGAVLNRDVLVRKDHYLQIFHMLTQCVVANLSHGVRFLGREERGVSLAPGKGLLGRRMAYIPCAQVEGDEDGKVHYLNIDWRSPRKREPRSLSDIHLMELAPQGCDGLVCLSRRVAHLAELRVDRPELLFIEDVVAAPLNEADTRIGGNEQQRKKANPVRKFVEIAILLGCSAVGFYHGLPRRNGLGFLITCAALLCFMSGFVIILSLLP